MFFLRFFVCIVGVFHSCLGKNELWRAHSPGDIIIGGLFPIHETTDRTTTPGPLSCINLDVSVFLLSQVMIYTIDQINQNTPRLLPNFTLGYDIYDTCGDVSIAMIATLQLLKNQSNPNSCLIDENPKSALPDPEVKAVIGEMHSQVSVAVARVVALSSLAQISYGSTSEALSNKLKFPTFLRTVSSDKYQTQGIAELVKLLKWKTVAIIGSDDEYGKYGSDSLETLFNENKICLEFNTILPDNFQSRNTSDTLLPDIVKNISESVAEAIIIFTKNTNVYKIMEEAVKNRLNRTWIASDSWATNTHIASIKDIKSVGKVFGFISKRNKVPGFENYVKSMFNATNNTFLNDFLHNCSEPKKNGEDNCTSSNVSINCLNMDCLANYIDHDISYSIYLAVRVVLEGLRHLLKCNNTHCESNKDFTAAELLMEIKKINFTLNTTHLFFNSYGDPSVGYDIVRWNMTESKTDFVSIGEYWTDLKVDIEEPEVNVTIYNCSKTCGPGYQLKVGDKKCCSYCVLCADGEYSPGNGANCKACVERHYSSPKRDECLNKTEEFLQWSNPFSIILTTFGGLGIIATVVFAVLFAINLRTPIVKAVGGKLCFLELFSLLICFCLPFTFIGKPTLTSCMVGLPVFGIAFSLCISCILSNLLQIFVGFSFELQIGSWFKKLNQPVVIVTIISGIQLSLCVSWLHYNSPFPEEDILTDIIVYECNKGSNSFFIAMIGYNAFLALICLLFAFKGKKLPDLYKNARLITISMLLFLIIWILFIQIYINKYERNKLAVECGAILVSSYSILCCHLAPKCYIMLFRKELNDESAITEYIRRHYEQKGINVVNLK